MPTLNGNSLSCEEILDRYGPLVYRMAIQGTGSVADGEDVAQEVFVSLIQCDPRFADETHLKAWLIRATANRCKSWGRSPWHRRTVPLEEARQAAPPPETGGTCPLVPRIEMPPVMPSLGLNVCFASSSPSGTEMITCSARKSSSFF